MSYYVTCNAVARIGIQPTKYCHVWTRTWWRCSRIVVMENAESNFAWWCWGILEHATFLSEVCVKVINKPPMNNIYGFNYMIMVGNTVVYPNLVCVLLLYHAKGLRGLFWYSDIKIHTYLVQKYLSINRHCVSKLK